MIVRLDLLYIVIGSFVQMVRIVPCHGKDSRVRVPYGPQNRRTGSQERDTSISFKFFSILYQTIMCFCKSLFISSLKFF